MKVLCLGLSHQTANVELREKFAVADADLISAANQLGAMEGIDEAVVVSTCNRVEFYVGGGRAGAGFAAVDRFLGRARRNTDSMPGDLLPTTLRAQSIRHLFRVVSGLDSMVLGETEILGQVKKAYAARSQRRPTSKHLNKLFQRAFNVAKEVRTNTNITRGAVCVGSVAVDLAEKIFGRLARAT